MNKFASTQRFNVTVDDRRAVFMMVRSRSNKPINGVEVPRELFIRRALKDRLGINGKDPAPDSVKQAAREMADMLAPKVEVTA